MDTMKLRTREVYILKEATVDNIETNIIIIESFKYPFMLKLDLIPIILKNRNNTPKTAFFPPKITEIESINTTAIATDGNHI